MSRYIAGLLLCMTLPVFPIQAQAQELALAPQAAQTPTMLSGITRTLQAYPDQVKSILHYYVRVDTSRIDIEKFTEIVKRNDYNEIYTEVSKLSQNVDAFNNGSFTDVPYYKVKPVIAPVSAPEPKIATTSTSSVSKSSSFYKESALVVVGGAVVAAAAFGGSGGGSDNNTPDPQDSFNRTMLPDTAPPSTFVDTEFSNYHLNGLSRINAQYAYSKGLTGLGVKIGFYDFFSDDSSSDPELNSRITYRDLNIAADTIFLAPDCAASPGLPEACNHGGAVMAYAANDRDGTGTMGVAYKATLLMSSIFKAADARTLADQGVDILNFSCGGCGSLADMQYIASKNILMTSATGNDGTANPNVSSPARFASQLDYSMIAVIGVYNNGGVLTSFGYDQCGNQREYCLSAYSDLGTSFAAPQVAGAAALIKEGWNFLTPKQISQILLYSAKDIGVAGVDNAFGHGLLDLKAATEPVGGVSSLNGQGVSGNYAPSIIAQNQTSAFGDAFSNPNNAKGNVVVVDSFGRDFNVKTQDNLMVAKTQTLSPSTLRLLGKKAPMRKINVTDQFSLQFSQQEGENGGTDVASYAEYNVTPNTAYAFGFATDMNNLVQDDTLGFDKSVFISNDVFRNGFLNFSDNNQVFFQSVQLGLASNTKTKLSTYYSSQNNASDYFEPVDNQVRGDFVSAMLETTVSPVENMHVNFKNGMTNESDTLLGSKLSGSFDLQGGADTYFTGLDVSYDVMPDLNLSASYTYGMTTANPSAQSAFNRISDLTSDSFFVTATKRNILGNDSLGFSIGQPTRVRSGTASGLTQSVDPSTGSISIVGFEQSLVPTGQTILFQAAYDKALNEKISMNLAFEYSNQPYQQSNANSEIAALAKVVYKFD